MWGLLPTFSNTVTYRPTANATTGYGTTTNPTYAYDVDSAPWYTRSETVSEGSSTPGTPSSTSVVFSGFTSLANPVGVELQVVYSLLMYMPLSGGSYVNIVWCGATLEYSLDGGYSWTATSFGKNPAEISIGTPGTTFITTQKMLVSVPNGALTNLSNLRVKITTSTLTQVAYGVYSRVIFNICDIQARVTQ